MTTDYLSQLPPDLFMKHITYLPFDTVVSICNINSKLHSYCTHPSHSLRWKALIDNTFNIIDGYDEKLKQIWKKLNISENTYNYLVYTQLIKILDPITQLMIYYRQGDKKFNTYKNVQQFLALFLLGKKSVIGNYLPEYNRDDYLPFIDFLNGVKISKEDLNNMLIEMAKEGNILGIKFFEKMGADIHDKNDYAFRLASKYGHLDLVKYLRQNGANIHASTDFALIEASSNGHLDVVKYLVSEGADIHANANKAQVLASYHGHLDVLEYLFSK